MSIKDDIQTQIDQMERIAVALERIASALEWINYKTAVPPPPPVVPYNPQWNQPWTIPCGNTWTDGEGNKATITFSTAGLDLAETVTE